MFSPTERHTYKPTPTAGIVVGVLILVGISVPGAVLAPTEFFAGAGSVMLAVCGAGALGLILLGRLRVELVLDRTAKLLKVTRIRWPLRTLEWVLPLDEIAGVELQSRNASSVVVLVLRDGARRPLVGGRSRSGAHAETLEVLQRWFAP